MRRALDFLYTASGWLAGVAMILLMVMVMLGILGAQFGFFIRGLDAYAGYMMASMIFLSLAHTFKRGEHIRVTLILERLNPTGRRNLDLVAFGLGVALSGLMAVAAVRLIFISIEVNDVSQAMDATPMWIPQLAFAFGTIVFFIAMVDEFIGEITGTRAAPSRTDEPAHIE